MARLIAPMALLLAFASVASAQFPPATTIETTAPAGPTDVSTALLGSTPVAPDEIFSPGDTSATKWSTANGSSGRRRHDDSLLNGLLIGAGVGTVLCIVYFHDEVPAAGLPLIVGTFALLGAWIDARVETVQPGGLSPPAGRPVLRASVNARVRF